MKKKTMGVLLTILLLSVYGISVNAKQGGNPFDEIWDYINSVINPTLEDHEARITALEGSVGPLEQPIRIGITSASTDDFVETVCVAAIAEADINQYVEDLGLDMTFEFVLKNNQGQFAIAWENTVWFKQNGIDLIIGHPWSGHCEVSLDYVNTNNMLLISGSSTSPALAIPNDRLFRISPHHDELVFPLAEMWETWGVEYVLTMQLDDPHHVARLDNFESELGIRGIESLGRILYKRDADEWDNNYAEKLEEANDTITEAIVAYGVDRVGIQFISGGEIVQLQILAADYPNLIDIIWMTAEEGPRSMRILDEAGEWATQTRHFNPIVAVDETSFPYQEFVEKYYALTEEMPGFYTAMQYDACWLLVETIIETGSTDAGVIADNLIPISDSIYGLSGCLALDENGDRLPQLYDISGFYEDPVSEEYELGIFGSYDGRTLEVSWDDDFLEYTGITRPGK